MVVGLSASGRRIIPGFTTANKLTPVPRCRLTVQPRRSPINLLRFTVVSSLPNQASPNESYFRFAVVASPPNPAFANKLTPVPRCLLTAQHSVRQQTYSGSSLLPHRPTRRLPTNPISGSPVPAHRPNPAFALCLLPHPQT